MSNKYIGIISDNSIEMISLIVKIWNAGDCVAIIDWRQPLSFIYEAVIKANISICYLDKKNYDKLHKKLKSICLVKMISADIQRIPLIYPIEWMSAYVDRYTSDDALILFSSGTTGKAKGIVLSHYAINTNADAIIQHLHLNQNDILGIIKPLTHSSTIVGELLVGLKLKIPLIIFPLIYSPRILLHFLSKHRVSIICLNPFLLELLTNTMPNYKIDTIRKIFVSGEALSLNLLKKASQRFANIPICNMYGLTEAGPRVTMQDQMDLQIISAGKCINGVTIQIQNIEGHTLKPNSIGSIFVNTPSKFTRIIGEEERQNTNKIFIDTGDMGYLDKENNLHIVGRIDSMFQIHSHNIYPEVLEDRLLNACPCLKECLIVKEMQGIGDKLVCYYTVDFPNENISVIEHTMYQICVNNFASFEIPSQFILTNELPHNSNGKKIRKVKKYFSEERDE